MPQPLIDTLVQTTLTPLISNMLLWLKENNLPLYDAFPEALIKQKIMHLAAKHKSKTADSQMTQQLVLALQQELQLATNPFEILNADFFSNK